MGEAERENDFPRLRVDIAHGDALNRGGDWYGKPVNLAARVATVADAGAVVATSAIAHETSGRFRWEALGSRPFEGHRRAGVAPSPGTS